MGVYHLSGPQKAVYFVWYMVTVCGCLFMAGCQWAHDMFGLWAAAFTPAMMLLNIFIIGPAYARWMDWRSKQFAKRFWENEGR